MLLCLAPPIVRGEIDFARDVRPIFNSKCGPQLGAVLAELVLSNCVASACDTSMNSSVT